MLDQLISDDKYPIDDHISCMRNKPGVNLVVSGAE